VKATGATGAVVGLAGCSGGGGGSGGDGGNGGGGGSGGGGGGGQTDTATPINTEPPTEEVTIQWAADSNFTNASDRIMSTLRENGLPENINVEILGGSFVTDDRRSKYNQVLNAGQGDPTIIMMDNGWTIPFIVRDQLLNLSRALPSDLMDRVEGNYFDAMLSTARGPDGSLFAIPLFIDLPTMQYRKDIVENAGYDPESENWATEPMTWERFSNVVADVKSQNPEMAGYNFQAAVYEGLSCCDFIEWMGSWGGSYFGALENNFGPVGDRPITVTEDPVVNAIRMVRTFINGSDDPEALDGYAGGISPEAVVQYREEDSRQPFTNGDVIFHRNWPYSININAAPDAFGEDLGVMPIPFANEEGTYYEGIGGTTSALGGWHLAINPNSSSVKQQAAATFLNVITQEQVQLDMFEIGGWTPPVPERVANDRTRQLDIIGRYVDTLKVAGENAMPRPVTPVWPQQSSQIAQAVNSSLRQEQSPTAAMEGLQAALEQIEASGSS
jgi:ABC-type glycerol-3-phosphate transport system substrate-binding protein